MLLLCNTVLDWREELVRVKLENKVSTILIPTEDGKILCYVFTDCRPRTPISSQYKKYHGYLTIRDRKGRVTSGAAQGVQHYFRSYVDGCSLFPTHINYYFLLDISFIKKTVTKVDEKYNLYLSHRNRLFLWLLITKIIMVQIIVIFVDYRFLN